MTSQPCGEQATFENGHEAGRPGAAPDGPGSAHLPSGYRSGIITAITVMLGFSLLFLRSWVFELPGDWTPSSIIAAGILLVAILLELMALWRSLLPKDDLPSEYRVTLRWFITSSLTLLLSLIVAAFSYGHVK